MDNSATLEISKVIMAIRNNAADKKAVEQQLTAIQENFGEDAFVPYNFEKEEKPWSDVYFSELDKKITAGAWSKDFILHFAEVHDEIQKNKACLLKRMWTALPRTWKITITTLFAGGAIIGTVAGAGLGGTIIGAAIGGLIGIISIRIVTLVLK